MSEKGLSNNPKVRVKVAKKYNVEMQSKKIQGEIHSRSTVDRGYRYSYERVYPKRIDQFNKSYQSGKAVYNSPNKPNTKISMNTGKNYSETVLLSSLLDWLTLLSKFYPLNLKVLLDHRLRRTPYLEMGQ